MVDFLELRLKTIFKQFLQHKNYIITNESLSDMCDIYKEFISKPPDISDIVDSQDIIENEIIPELKLSSDQVEAWSLIKTWANNKEPHFILRGYAGSGKTFLLRMLKDLGKSIFYSAPTNKAAKVLSKSLNQPTKTTFSLFGLKLEHDDEELILKKISNHPYFPPNSIIVVDEASMVGSLLFEAIEEVRESQNLKILYVGDPLQLPPVKESRSPAWQVTKDLNCKFTLKEIMRYDNQLLSLATDIRDCISNKQWSSPLTNNHDENQGVWWLRNKELFIKEMLSQITSKTMQNTKVIAWRNKTVTTYNDIIRQSLGFFDDYNIGDSILLAEPIEKDEQIIAHTDDEFIINELKTAIVPIDGNNVDVYQMLVKGDQDLVLNIAINQQNLSYLLGEKAKLAYKASGIKRKELWKEFWETKSKFHNIRFGYALTAHRAQGSTYHTCFVDQQDILANPTKREAFRCLYVACTRASNRLYSF